MHHHVCVCVGVSVCVLVIVCVSVFVRFQRELLLNYLVRRERVDSIELLCCRVFVLFEGERAGRYPVKIVNGVPEI